MICLDELLKIWWIGYEFNVKWLNSIDMFYNMMLTMIEMRVADSVGLNHFIHMAAIISQSQWLMTAQEYLSTFLVMFTWRRCKVAAEVVRWPRSRVSEGRFYGWRDPFIPLWLGERIRSRTCLLRSPSPAPCICHAFHFGAFRAHVVQLSSQRFFRTRSMTPPHTDLSRHPLNCQLHN